ncbi:hypothetical protein ROJ8625_00234 [Roseivivax jejudonensis]|uniref:Uncharacterized protein n=1 Tax=Roseivivax jejudonensis TaxID=1529041 RepID=A0A1X6Y5B7_9RHOB|nr:hypothetical protein [Roseivivax jejudonensis]SLN11047.1 hypothetical protein ROJ8625_00234 [Roseivivax jejudonensis]
MAEQNPYILDEVGLALAAKHFAQIPEIRSDEEFAHYARQVIQASNQHSVHTPLEARAMIVAVLHRLIEYDGNAETPDACA